MTVAEATKPTPHKTLRIKKANIEKGHLDIKDGVDDPADSPGGVSESRMGLQGCRPIIESRMQLRKHAVTIGNRLWNFPYRSGPLKHELSGCALGSTVREDSFDAPR
jgi:hypothetical protein